MSPSLRRVDGEEVWKISGAGLSEPVINSPPVARLVGRVKIAEVEAPPKKKPCEALAPRDVWLFFFNEFDCFHIYDPYNLAFVLIDIDPNISDVFFF